MLHEIRVSIFRIDFAIRENTQSIFSKQFCRQAKLLMCTFRTEQRKTRKRSNQIRIRMTCCHQKYWSSPRSISTVKLNASRRLHIQPINHVVFMGPYLITQWDILS